MKINDNVIYADEGMVLTNGELFGKTVILAACADASAYYEITEEEYSAIMAEEMME